VVMLAPRAAYATPTYAVVSLAAVVAAVTVGSSKTLFSVTGQVKIPGAPA
jgi:hypothetical protein